MITTGDAVVGVVVHQVGDDGGDEADDDYVVVDGNGTDGGGNRLCMWISGAGGAYFAGDEAGGATDVDDGAGLFFKF